MKKIYLIFTIISLVFLGGCATSDDLMADSAKPVSEMAKGPKTSPYRTVTNFSGAVRCMDGMLSDYGIKDISILVEDIEDSTKKVGVGSRDMLLSTVSEMTRRSRAIKFISYGGDQRNIVGFLAASNNMSAFSTVPQYDIRGSITQFDDNVVKNTNDVGFGITDYLTLGKSTSATAKILGLDLSIVNTSDLSLVPGVNSKNAVAIFTQGDGIDSEARYNKFGLNYATSLSRSEGTAVAVRNLIELASVELIGKLTKVPYWRCMGSSSNVKEIKTEVEDWFEGMANNPAELFAYFQYQLSLRGVYKGAVNGVPTPDLSIAIKKYKIGMGLQADSNLNAEFLAAYLDADHEKVATRLEAMDQSHISRAPIKLAISQLPVAKPAYTRKEKIKLQVKADIPAYVYCFLFDSKNAAMRIYPNRFSTNVFFDGSRPIQLPDSSKYNLVANENGLEEVIECYGTHKDVLPLLKEPLKSSDLTTYDKSISGKKVRAEFAKVGGDGFGVANFTIKIDTKSK